MEKFEFFAKSEGRVSKLIINEVPHVSFALVQKLFRNKDVILNGNRINKDCPCKQGDKITFFANLSSKKITVKTIYEDDNVLIVFKPHKMEVSKKDKSHSSSITLEEVTGFRACHRLDRNTEGLVVLAKNEVAYKEVVRSFKERGVKKFYTALAFGMFEKQSETLKAYLVKDEKNSIVKVSLSDGEEIITKYSVLKEFDKFSLLEVELVTGKTHQIRAHLDFIGHSIVGDEKYCSKQNRKLSEFYFKEFGGYALTSTKIKFLFCEKSKLEYLNGKEFVCSPTWNIEK